MKIAIITVFTRNYLAGARTVLESAGRWMPEAGLIGYLADEAEGILQTAKEAFRIVPFTELEVPNYRAMAFVCPPVALCCMLKGFAAHHALSRLGFDAVIYVDCDTWFTHRPEAMLKALTASPLVITPHRLTPASPGTDPTEASLIPFGAYNAGTFGVRNSKAGVSFLRWWGQRLIEPGNCVLQHGYDQAWLNYASVYWPATEVLRNPAFNVAVWNLNERLVDWDRVNGYTANKLPMELYHFSFFDPTKPKTPFPGAEGWQFTSTDGLQRLLKEYADSLHTNGFHACRAWGCSWDRFSDGSPVLAKHRDYFRAKFMSDCRPEDDPFDVAADRFGKGVHSLHRAHTLTARVMRGCYATIGLPTT